MITKGRRYPGFLATLHLHIFRSFLWRMLLPEDEPSRDRYDYPASPWARPGCGHRRQQMGPEAVSQYGASQRSGIGKADRGGLSLIPERALPKKSS
jgi:hypothetical protein